MNWIVLQGVKPWDGRYELDLVDLELTTREWGWIKRLSGYMPLTVDDGFKGGDPELFAVFAAIALRRAGRIDARDVPDVFDRLADSPFGSTLSLEGDTGQEQDDEDGDADPPASSPGNASSSGDGSTRSSETSPSPLNGSGTPASDTSVSAPVRSGT